MTVPYDAPALGTTLGNEQWAQDVLTLLGHPDKSVQVDNGQLTPGNRVQFLAAQAQVEAVPPGENNPLGSTLPEPGSATINSAGVQAYPTAAEGAQATAALLQQPNMRAYLSPLTKSGSTLTQLRTGLSKVPWDPSGPESAYATAVYDTATGAQNNPGAGGITQAQQPTTTAATYGAAVSANAFGKVLVSIDRILNPPAPGGLTSVLSLGSADVFYYVRIAVTRVAFALPGLVFVAASLGLDYVAFMKDFSPVGALTKGESHA
ncbi:MAG: hypothetical protein ACYCV4_02475 [Dermatophilaceae bacterium]